MPIFLSAAKFACKYVNIYSVNMFQVFCMTYVNFMLQNDTFWTGLLWQILYYVSYVFGSPPIPKRYQKFYFLIENEIIILNMYCNF